MSRVLELSYYLELICALTWIGAMAAHDQLRRERVRWARDQYARAFERLRARFSELTPVMQQAGAAMDALNEQLKNYGKVSRSQTVYSDAVDAVAFALSSFPTQKPPPEVTQ